MKKLVSMFIIVCMLMANAIPAFATSYSEESQKIVAETLSEEMTQKLSDIPIYITPIEENENLTDAEKDVISRTIADSCSNNRLNAASVIDNYGVIKLTDTEKQDILSSPIYSSTLNRIAEIVNKGTTVKYINIFVPAGFLNNNETSVMSANGNADDISYWESNCFYLGSYNGYKFLYLESSVGVETSEVTPGNISGSLKWDAIAQKTLEVVLDHYVKNNYYKAVRAVANGLSTLFSMYESPLSITYSASSGYVKAKVSGDLYLRTVLIRDDLDRVEGYAYYNWGTTERFAAALRVDAKYPYKQNTSGTYEYKYPSYTFSTQNSNTPGYYGNNTFFSSVISLYTNTIGYFTHDESIDVYSAVASLLG